MSDNDGSGGDRRKFGLGFAQVKNVFSLPDERAARRQREFCDAVARLKRALAEENSLPVPTRQALVAELGVFDSWTDDRGAGTSPAGSPVETARRILLLDYRLSVLRPLAAELDPSLRHAVRQYAESSRSLLEVSARRGPDGEWLDMPRRTELDALMRALHPGPEGDKS